jgi:UPF0755 protein
LGALVVALLFSIYIATRPHHDFPADSAGQEVSILISNGESGTSIAQELEAKGVIKEAKTYIELALKDARTNAVSPGTHRIQTHITTEEALQQLLDRKRLAAVINVIEGSTASDVFSLIHKDPHVSGSPQQAARLIKPPLANSRYSLEGMLFPASYSFGPGTSAKSALQQMADLFASQSQVLGLDSGYLSFSPYEVLIIASMVQIEGDESDFEKVASVIYNRLRIGMPLQLNSTVQYAAGLRGRINISTAATKIASPYNTYRNIGLPPTPISNPGAKAITAALHPVKSKWLYFITVKPHDTRFTDDYKQFQEWETLFNKNRVAGAFK